MKNNTTVTNANVNPANAIVKPAKTFWKEKVNAVRTDALMKSVGLDASTVKSVYAQKPDGMELYTSYATTSVEAIANKTIKRSIMPIANWINCAIPFRHLNTNFATKKTAIKLRIVNIVFSLTIYLTVYSD